MYQSDNKSKAFEIEMFAAAKALITVSIIKNNAAIPITIPQDKFELFLLTNGKLRWELHLSDGKATPESAEGNMTLEEYWSLEDKIIHEDLYEYIVTNPIKYNGTIYENSLDSITGAFDRRDALKLTAK